MHYNIAISNASRNPASLFNYFLGPSDRYKLRKSSKTYRHQEIERHNVEVADHQEKQ